MWLDEKRPLRKPPFIGSNIQHFVGKHASASRMSGAVRGPWVSCKHGSGCVGAASELLSQLALHPAPPWSSWFLMQDARNCVIDSHLCSLKENGAKWSNTSGQFLWKYQLVEKYGKVASPSGIVIAWVFSDAIWQLSYSMHMGGPDLCRETSQVSSPLLLGQVSWQSMCQRRGQRRMRLPQVPID